MVTSPQGRYAYQSRKVLRLPPAGNRDSPTSFFASSGLGKGSGFFFLDVMTGFSYSAPELPVRHRAQPRGHVVRHSSAVSGLPWSYTLSKGCGASTEIYPSPIQRKLTSRLGSVDRRCPPVSGEGNGQRSIMVSDCHYCRAVNLQDPPLFPYGSHLTANKAPTLWGWASQLFPAPEGYGG
ncbi:hypothetical protein PoB_007330500 [Plakobranchus ocellatus]|uniref:Uncharacterized protein n=1 Tax=Plakobranchus ocellatus TaxID=259542 RepID=A0AAV4DRZ6_9GAST|nr:hypothetical protein PoB_007330500 [Plakobranchus ocellatus]